MSQQNDDKTVIAHTIGDLKTFLNGCKDDLRIAPDPLALWIDDGELFVDFANGVKEQ